jgi:hypothetical protein
VKASKVPVTDTFEEVKNHVYKMVWDFLAVNDVDQEEAISAGHLGFMQAYHSFKPELGWAFTTWVGIKVQKRLLDLLRSKINDSRRPVVQVDFLEFDLPDVEYAFSIDEWMETLSEEARLAATYAINPPIDVVWFVKKFQDESPASVRQAIRETLKEAEWSMRKIRKAFKEIKEAL